MKKFECVNDFIILKFTKIKSALPFYIPDTKNESILKNAQVFEPIAEVYSAGSNVKAVTAGAQVYYVQRAYAEIPLDKIIGLEKNENAVYVKAKEEDIIAVIS